MNNMRRFDAAGEGDKKSLAKRKKKQIFPTTLSIPSSSSSSRSKNGCISACQWERERE
jgi:hypothetical protein